MYRESDGDDITDLSFDNPEASMLAISERPPVAIAARDGAQRTNIAKMSSFPDNPFRHRAYGRRAHDHGRALPFTAHRKSSIRGDASAGASSEDASVISTVFLNRRSRLAHSRRSRVLVEDSYEMVLGLPKFVWVLFADFAAMIVFIVLLRCAHKLSRRKPDESVYEALFGVDAGK